MRKVTAIAVGYDVFGGADLYPHFIFYRDECRAFDCELWELPELCDCCDYPGDLHRWHCAGTPLWAETMRDLDLNPWTALAGAMFTFTQVPGDYYRRDHCGLGPCCLGDGHAGRCAL